MAVLDLNTPIEYLKGVGPSRGATLRSEAGIFTFYDLLNYFPFRYIDKTLISKVRDIQSQDEMYQFRGKVTGIREIKQQKGRRVEAFFQDDTGRIKLVWFRGVKWILNTLNSREEYLLFGKPSMFAGQMNIAHPELEKVGDDIDTQSSKLQPVYHSGEKLSARGLTSRGFEKMISQLLRDIGNNIPEILSSEILYKYKLPSRLNAYQKIHFPNDEDEMKRAKWRLKFEEFFFIQLKMGRNKKISKRHYKGLTFDKIGDVFNTFYGEHLPFELTGAQKKVLKEIRHDLKSGYQMNRLMQGDVGSGKTIVALFCMLMAKDNGFQSCLMAPTEILAQQHFKTLQEYLTEMNVTVVLLTGSSKTTARREIAEGLSSGEVDIIVGTHALLEDKVVFKNLGFAVIDEQHRFGVAQRAKLWKKNITAPHVLVMTATPIPRTLAMTVYGDLDVSVIDELPPGRKEIRTMHRFENARLKVFQFIEDEIKKGRQAYIVYPLIEESETLDYKDLMDGYASISSRFPKPEYQLSIVHGRMKSEDKDFEMQRFAKGETQILVATTVIEVGVNVPNASMMLIESAERFGLSQLHQLRGRVGRGSDQSYCVLMTGYKLSEQGRIRMDTMVRTTDGFEIAEVDLQLRGPGDMMGTQQSGIPELRIGNLVQDADILKISRDEAFEIIEKDPDLNSPQNSFIAKHYEKLKKELKDWSVVA